MRETDLGRVAKGWLENSRGLEAFQEVVAGGHRIDLVGRRHGCVVTVECKVSFGLPVIAQAQRWLAKGERQASESWVCVAQSRRASDERRLGRDVCDRLGIGVLEVDGGRWRVAVGATSSNPPDLSEWNELLHQEQKDAAPAGTNGGGYSTDFKRTCVALVETVTKSPGITLKDAVVETAHHYQTRASAVSALSRLLSVARRRPVELAPIRIEGRGSRALLFPTGEETF
ncbi:MAG: hypothetical protein AMXMBFR56_65970 [Polyangiaceae bacterium]